MPPCNIANATLINSKSSYLCCKSFNNCVYIKCIKAHVGLKGNERVDLQSEASTELDLSAVRIRSGQIPEVAHGCIKTMQPVQDHSLCTEALPSEKHTTFLERFFWMQLLSISLGRARIHLITPQKYDLWWLNKGLNIYVTNMWSYCIVKWTDWRVCAEPHFLRLWYPQLSDSSVCRIKVRAHQEAFHCRTNPCSKGLPTSWTVFTNK